MSSSDSVASSSSLPQGSPEATRPAPIPSSPGQSEAAVRAREFAADLFRRAHGGGGATGQAERTIADDDNEKEARQIPADKEVNVEGRREEARRTSLPQTSAPLGSSGLSNASSSPSPSSQEAVPGEPGYVNYSHLHYCLQQPGAAEQNAGGGRKRVGVRQEDV